MKPGDAVEEMPRQDLTRKLHQPQRAKEPRPLERRQLPLEQLAEEDAVAVEQQPYPLLIELFPIEGVER